MSRTGRALITALLALAGAAPLAPAAHADPAAPRDVRANPVPGGQGWIDVTWTRPQPEGDSWYQVYRDVPGAGPQHVGEVYNAGVLRVTGHVPGGAGYCYRVRRYVDGQGYSGMSAMGCGYAGGVAAMAAPGTVTVVPIGPGRLYVAWVRPAPDDGSTYELHRNDGTRWVRMASVGDVYSTHLTGLAGGSTYCLNVVRLRDGGRSGFSPAGCGTVH
ncbi:MAG TPA: fibronectin type III domain-containing protein [Pseudonocardiaceae bacterium]